MSPPRDIGRALLLTGSIGNGHRSVAQACEDALESGGVEVRTRDSMELLGLIRRSFGIHAYRRLLSFPGIYDAFHFAQLRDGGHLAERSDAASSKVIASGLDEEFAWLGDGLVLSVFATGTGAAEVAKYHGSSSVSVALVTDAAAHVLWVHEGTDLFIVGSELTAATVRQHRPRAPIAVLTPPVRREFYDAPPRSSARQSLGIPEDARCALIMTSGWGIGPVLESSLLMSKRGWWVMAVAGSNRKLERRLRSLGSNPRIIPFGFTERVPELMAAADVVVTSSGQACHEARVVGRRMVLMDIVPGHGRENMMHELELGGAVACLGTPESVTAATEACADITSEPEAWPVSSADQWGKLFFEALGTVGIVPRGASGRR